jgi:hypothetical protein
MADSVGRAVVQLLRSPQPAPCLPRLPLQLPERFQGCERESGVRMPVPLSDDLGVHEGAIVEVHIGKDAAILVVTHFEMSHYPFHVILDS